MQEIRTSGSMSGDGKRSVAAWPKLPRPSSTLPTGGGKDPDFWYAFEEGKVKVIGDEPANTDYHPGPSEKAVS